MAGASRKTFGQSRHRESSKGNLCSLVSQARNGRMEIGHREVVVSGYKQLIEDKRAKRWRVLLEQVRNFALLIKGFGVRCG